MLSKNRQKQIIALQRKKNREQEKLFIIEGDKLVREFLLSGFTVKTLLAKPEFINGLDLQIREKVDEVIPVSFEDLRKMSSFTTPHNAMAIVRMPEETELTPRKEKKLYVVLDFIQDPGNLGTIIRSASWFGIDKIVCSKNCVDVYNPKVLQATMGAIINTNVYYTDIDSFLQEARNIGLDVYGTLLEGDNIYSANLNNEGVIVLGNESKGISEEIKKYLTVQLTIPKFGKSDLGTESLNAAMAASVVFSEFARRRG